MSSSPALTPRAMTPSARSGSNIRGKMVTKSIRIESLRKVDDDFSSGHIDFPADRNGERHLVRLAVLPLYVEQHAAAPFVDLDDLSAVISVGIDEMEANEVMVKILVRRERAGLALGNLDGPAAQQRDLFRRFDSGERDQRPIAVCTGAFDDRIARAIVFRRHERDSRQF